MRSTPTLRACYQLVAKDEHQWAVFGSRRTEVDATASKAFLPIKRDHNQGSFKPNRKKGKKDTGGQVEHCNFCGKDGHNRDGFFNVLNIWSGGQERETKLNQSCIY